MKKEDLKTGMLVQYDNGRIRMVINDMFISDSYRCNIITDYSIESLGVKRVSKVLNGADLTPKNWTLETLNANLLWEREKVPEYVEIITSRYPSGLPKGGICEVLSYNCYNINEYTVKSMINENLTYYISIYDIKPSTKEAYEAQFKKRYNLELSEEEYEKVSELIK
jgi:hypothetical protein